MTMSQADFVNKNRQMAYKSQFANHRSRRKSICENHLMESTSKYKNCSCEKGTSHED